MNRQLAGWGLAAAFLAALIVAWWAAPSPIADRYRVLFIAADPSVEKITRGLDRLYADYPDLARQLDVLIRAPSNTLSESTLPAHDLLLVEILDRRWIGEQAPRIETEGHRRRFAIGPSGLSDDPGLPERIALDSDPVLDGYWENSDPVSMAGFFVYLGVRHLGIDGILPEPPQPPQANGYVVFEDGKPHITDAWPSNIADKRPQVAILEYATRARSGGLALTRAVAAALEARGVEPVIIFGERAVPMLEARLLDENGRNRVDAVVSFHLKFFETESAAVLERLGVPIINAIRVFGRTVEEWRRSPRGLTAGEVAFQLAIPELAGLAPPNVVGAIDNRGRSVGTAPIAERVDRVADRAARLARIHALSPAGRRVAVLYWNYPPGKQNVGASYLNVVRSIPGLLRKLAREGYAVDGLEDTTDEALERRIRERGLNIGGFAPGELEHLVDAGDVITLPASRYREWFSSLPRAFREAVIDHWGEVEDADIMRTDIDGEPHLVLPVIGFGNVIVMPQPDRARMQNLEALYQSQELPPHHQYVAAYLWLQREFRADAVVHTGTHGTHEWMSGKEAGLSGSDPGEVLAGDLHIVYPYIVDDVGEGIVAKRRGMATVVDHLTPALGDAGLSPELTELHDLLARWRLARGTNPERADEIAGRIDSAVVKRGLDLDLADRGWSDADAGNPNARFAALEDYITQVSDQTIPLGLHTFGVSPSGERLARFVDRITQANGSGMADAARQRLVASGPAEFEGLRTGLAARYVRPGPGNDPVRNPDAIPTGKNFGTFDPRTVPLPAAGELGAQMAESLIARHRERHGEMPEKVALQLWGVETLRHQGVQEAQGLALLGVRPVRDERGRISDLKLIPREVLGRPRVDVVFHATSLYRDTFPMLLELIDRAVQLAASSPEADNPVRNHIDSLSEKLVAEGMDRERARRRAALRIFAEPSGKHDSKLHAMTHASGSWDKEAQVADNYIRRMGHAYGGGLWGVPAREEFRAALADTDTIVHSRASNLYATLDNDDYFSYGGSIALGVRRVNGGGRSPDFYVTDLRRDGEERHEPLERFMGQELRSRYLNPEFAGQMMQEGYAGGRHVWKAVDYLWGWQVVYPEAVDAAKWQEMHEVWINDRYDLGIESFFEEHNPYARQGIASRMLEVVRKGYWDAPTQTRAELVEAYVDSLVRHGPACDHLSCDNPELQQFVRKTAASVGLDSQRIEAAMDNIERATGRSIEAALAERTADKVRWHQPPPEPAVSAGESPDKETSVSGYKMIEEDRERQDALQAPPQEIIDLLALAGLTFLLASLFSGSASRYRNVYRLKSKST